jgi:hypothetical protein
MPAAMARSIIACRSWGFVRNGVASGAFAAARRPSSPPHRDPTQPGPARQAYLRAQHSSPLSRHRVDARPRALLVTRREQPGCSWARSPSQLLGTYGPEHDAGQEPAPATLARDLFRDLDHTKATCASDRCSLRLASRSPPAWDNGVVKFFVPETPRAGPCAPTE